MSSKNYTRTHPQDSNSVEVDYRNTDLLKALNMAIADGGGEPLLIAVIKVILTGKVDVTSPNVQRILSERLDPKDFRALKERLMTDNLEALASSSLVTSLLATKDGAAAPINDADRINKQNEAHIPASDNRAVDDAAKQKQNDNQSSSYSYNPNSNKNTPKGP